MQRAVAALALLFAAAPASAPGAGPALLLTAGLVALRLQTMMPRSRSDARRAAS